MRKRLFFPLLGVTILILSTLAYDAFLVAQLDEHLSTLRSELKTRGWTLSWTSKSRHYWTMQGDDLDLARPVLSNSNGQGWAVDRVTLHARLFHPGSFSFVTAGTQILSLGNKALVTTGQSRGFVTPGDQSLSLGTDIATLSNLPLSGIDAIVLHGVTARVMLSKKTSPDAPAWAVDLRARSFMPKLSPAHSEDDLTQRLVPLLVAVPMPEHLHLILVALGHKRVETIPKLEHENYLIQEASFHLGPLSCVARGKLSDDGDGSLWLDLQGLRAFSHLWLTTIPEPVRENPDYTHLIATIDEQTARIPDRLSLPLPLNRYDILLQTHISAIIREHSR